MCGRYAITTAPEAIRQLFAYLEQPNFPPRYNVAPTQPVPIVRMTEGKRQLALVRWGLIPAWVKDPRKLSLLINARSETIREKPAFKNAIKRRRCLVPADGYYEWQVSGGRKRPHFIHRRDRQPIGFAALAETWIGPNGEELDTVEGSPLVRDAESDAAVNVREIRRVYDRAVKVPNTLVEELARTATRETSSSRSGWASP